MNPTQLDLAILTLLLKGLVLTAPLTVLLLLTGRRLSARSSSLAWRTLLLAMLALPLISWALPGLPLIGLDSFSTAAPPTTSVSVTASLPVNSEAAPATGIDHLIPDAVAPAAPVCWIFLIWISGTLLLGSRFALGQIKSIALRKKSQTFEEHQNFNALPASVELLHSSDTRLPLTCGLRQPAIIFPEEAANWDEETRGAVLAHELTHVRRRDLLFLMVSAFAVALHWPNPLVWLAARRMRLADERAADDVVLEKGVNERRYAQLLFDLARGNPASTGCLAAQFMAERSMIGSRIKCLLDSRQNRKAPQPLAVTGCSLAVLGAAFLIGMATVREASAEPEAKEEKAENAKKSEGQNFLEAKLKQIRIPVMDFDQATLEEAIDYLRARSRELDVAEPDPKKKGINILIQLNKEERKGLAEKTITLKLRDVPLSTALKYTTNAVGLDFHVGEFAVEIGNKPAPPAKPKEVAEKSEGQKFIEAKLKAIVLPSVDFQNASLKEALDYFRMTARQFDVAEPDPNKKGINILLRLNKEQQKELAEKEITLKLKNVPLAAALAFTAKAVDLDYRVSDFAVEVGKD